MLCRILRLLSVYTMSLIDFGFLQEISGNDPGYIYDVLEIFLGSVPQGIESLNNLIINTDDWDAIQKQSHTLKSSLGIVRIGNLHELMAKIEELAIKRADKDLVLDLAKEISETFNNAMPILEAEKDKYAAMK